MNKPAEFHIIANRAKEKIVLTREFYKGCDLVNIRKMYLSRDGNESWSKEGVALHPHEARELQRALNQIMGPQQPRTGRCVFGQGASNMPRTRPNQATLSLQDQVLLALASGLSPEDARVRVLGADPKSKRQLTEIGKALRRVGLLVPGDWMLTPAGEVRRGTLLEGKGKSQGEGEEEKFPYLVIPLGDEGGVE